MNRIKVYIAGKVTGLPHDQVRAKFDKAASMLWMMGFDPVNPVEIVPPDSGWNNAMRICIKELAGCELIYMLPDWYRSKGAIVERLLAWILKIKRIKIVNYKMGLREPQTPESQKYGK